MIKLKKINLILFFSYYIVLTLGICFSLFTLMKFSPPFSLINNTNVAGRIVFSSILVIILPGYLLFNLMQIIKRYEMDFFELLIVSFGVSLILIEILCIITIENGLNSTIAALCLSILSAILLVVSFLKEKKPILKRVVFKNTFFDKPSLMLNILFTLLIIITSFLLYKIESPISSGEDQLHISVIRKILENNIISKENIYYKPAVTYTYLYPGLHFMITLISRFSCLDPIIVYAKLRFILGILSLLILWTFSKVIFKSKYIAFVITSTCLALIYNGMAGQLPGFYCGQLIPVSHIGDISMGILLPLALIFSFKYILNKGIFNRFLVLSVLLFISVTIIHVREGVQIIFYYVATLFAYLVFNPKDKTTIYKILLFILSIVSLGMVYRFIHSYNVGHVVAVEDSCKKVAIEIFIKLSKNLKMAFSTPENYPDLRIGFIPAGKLIFKKYISLAMPMSLLILLFFRRMFWGLFFSSSIIVSLFFMKFNILATLLIIFTYSEIMYTPGRFILYFSYILYGFFIYIVLAGFDKICSCARDKSKHFLGIIWPIIGLAFIWLFSCLALVNFNNFIQEIIYKHGTLFLIIVSVVVFLIIICNMFSQRINNIKNYIMIVGIKYKLYSLLGLFCILYPIYQYGRYENTDIFEKNNIYRPAINIFDNYRARTATPDISDFKNYYSKTGIFNIPLDLIEFIRRDISAGNVFAYDRDTKEIVFIPVFSNQYIAVIPNHPLLSIKNLDDDYLDSFKAGRQIIFNDTEKDMEKLNFIYRFGFSFLILNPQFYHLNKIFSRYDSFQKVYDKDSYVIYKVDRLKLGSILRYL